MRRLVINVHNRKQTIAPELYGHFAEHLGRCIYEGIFVGPDSPIPNRQGLRLDVLNALKAVGIPVLRWPGGCFADSYHWRDGIGDPGTRPRRTNTFWGRVIEDNSFGTHEFLNLCEELGCQPYLAANVGSGSPREMADWMEYVTGTAGSGSDLVSLRRENGRTQPWQVRYWGIGNENWGCGGYMTPEYYADLYKQFACFAEQSTTQPLCRIACGPTGEDFRWTEVFTERAGCHVEALAMHYYTSLVRDPSLSGHDAFIPATGFTHDEYISILAKARKIDEFIRLHAAILRIKRPQRKIGLIVDEWGSWHRHEEGTNSRFLYQQNSIMDALVASTTFDCFNKNSDALIMANIAQTVNVLQAMVLTDGDHMLRTPTYHAFKLYRPHQGATLIDSFTESEWLSAPGHRVCDLSESASLHPDGNLHLTVSNLDPNQPKRLQVLIPDFRIAEAKGEILTGDCIDAHNTFDDPNHVAPRPFTDFALEGGLALTLPPRSILAMTLKP